MKYLGRNRTKVLFSSGNLAVVVDESKNVVESIDYVPVLASAYSQYSYDESPTPQAVELATAALTELDISVLTATDRMHTIPKSVQEEAKRALEWRSEFNRGGTPVGLNTARTLAKGGQIGIKKIRHIAKYFPRHEVDKKGKGYKPGDEGYPSKGRIAWALWGGDAAQKWATAIVERENKKENSTLVASNGYYEFDSPDLVDLSGFDSDAMKYMIRLRMDGTGVDRLYAIKPCGTVLVWDDGNWDDLGNVNHDIDTYDKSLDGPYDKVEKIHVPVDQEAAVAVAAMFDSNPFKARSIEEIAPEETVIFASALPELDYDLIDAIVAASSFKTDKDGNYTPEERSEKATSQLRDKLGRFAVTGSRVVLGGNPNYRGTIVSQDSASQTVKVELDDGKVIDIAANQTQQEDTVEPSAPTGTPAEGGAAPAKPATPVDTTGILGQTREVSAPPIRLSKKLPTLNKEAVSQLLTDFPAWVEAKRREPKEVQEEQARAAEEKPKSDFWYKNPDFDWATNKNAANDPELKKIVENSKKPPVGYDTYSAESITAAADPQEPSSEKTYENPRQSDVEPIYMAIVAQDDPQAVMDLIALIPEGPNSTAPMAFKREPGKWVPDTAILADLKSPTPPPVIVLDNPTLEEVIKQVDGPAVAAQRQIDQMEAKKAETAVAAAGFKSGGLNADRLKNYWLVGGGSSKIRWNSAGAFDRCVGYMAKHMGVRAYGFCALQNMEATGSWPEPITASLASMEEVSDFIFTRTQRRDAKNRVLTAGGKTYDASFDGAGFFIPLVLPEDAESGDGRIFDKGAITMRELPLPLLWQIKTGDGHNGSVVVGKILKMERTDDGIGNAYGVFDSGVYGKEAERLVRGGFIRGVSADLDRFEADEEVPDVGADDEDSRIGGSRIKIRKARVMAVTLVPKPAFQECQIQLVESENDQEDTVVPDGVYVDDVDAVEASSLVACGIVAGVIPTTPPAEWFQNPALKNATPLTVDDDGRVFGHIAAWHVDHIGMSFGTRPPRSRSRYAYFHTGVVRTQEGNDVPVGQLTLAGGHASLELSAHDAVRHYDDTASAIADVHAGEDAYGIWVAGALRPGTTPEQVRALRASAPSGDWRPIKGHLELVAVCQVNVPGFPIARARVASGQVMALVAAGANTLARMKSDPIADLQSRLDRIEAEKNQPMVAAAAEAARSRVMAVKAEELAAKVKKAKKEIAEDDISWMTRTFEDGGPESEASAISTETRKKLADEGKALPDGSYPIRNVSDLKNAIRAFGRAKPSERTKVRKHIVKRARGLGKESLIPDNWPEAPKKAEASIDEVPAEGLELAADDNPCWEGYEMVGYKEKDGKQVPNCVPVDASAEGVDADPFVASLRERTAIAQAMVAAGGLDRNRGNAERLRRYWTSGPGAMKIRWGTPGDWKRCVRYLSKYMGVRAKGYCQLRHKEATGVYTGSRLNPGRNNSIFSAFSEQEFGIFESLYGDVEKYTTEVTDLDMMLPLSKIMDEPDDVYDAIWEPDKTVVVLIKKCGYSPSGTYVSDDADIESENGMDDGIDASLDSYDDDGLLAAKIKPGQVPGDWVDVPEYSPEYERVPLITGDDGEGPEEDFPEPGDPSDLLEDDDIGDIEGLEGKYKGLKVKQKGKYTPDTQPRDAAGKFRKVLARLKVDLGTAGADRALDKIEEIENLDYAGDYGQAAEAAGDLINIIDRLDTKALNPEAIGNVRESSRELGKVIANLPFAFGEQAQKIRYSDLPPALRDLIEDMITRVEAKIGSEDADIATREIKSFMSGQDYYSQGDISAQMAKMLRLLT